jgi:hypothetical protein
MGVTASGKSTVALQLQNLHGWPFREGDDLHPPENVEKMRPGRPLDDRDRLPCAAPSPFAPTTKSGRKLAPLLQSRSDGRAD